MSQKKKVPAIDGWFVADGEIAHLIGTRCKSCGSYFFPRETYFCRNPACRGNDFEEIPLSRTGTLWSFTDNRYPPPAPYVAPDPFEPYIVAAVELDLEKMVVLGQVSSDVSIDDLSAGMKMELVIDSLYEDDENEYLVWKWRPSAG
jgi:uncharacterized OB-fold protein